MTAPADAAAAIAAAFDGKVDKGALVLDAADFEAPGRDDTTAVAAALAAARAAKGATVLLRRLYRITSTLDCAGLQDVTLKGTTRARTRGSGLVWAGPDDGTMIQCDNANGFVISGVAFLAASPTWRGTHVNFENYAVFPQAFHILIEWCFFAGCGKAKLHTNIRPGAGHNYTIRHNNFYAADVSIRSGFPVVGGVAGPTRQTVQSVLVERNWFEIHHDTGHISDPGRGWKITCNAFQSLPSTSKAGGGGAIRLLSDSPSLMNVTFEDNWCGDADPKSTRGAIIEVARGPFRIINNVLGTGGPGSAAIKAVDIINAGARIDDNRIPSEIGGEDAGGTFIDWGDFAHCPTPKSGAVYVTGNLVYVNVVQFTGRPPAALATDAGGNFAMPRKPTQYLPIKAGVVAIDPNAAPTVQVYLNADVTAITIAPGRTPGQTITITVTQDSTAARTVPWPSSFRWAGGYAPECSGTYRSTTVVMQWSHTGTWTEVSRSVNVPL